MKGRVAPLSVPAAKLTAYGAAVWAVSACRIAARVTWQPLPVLAAVSCSQQGCPCECCQLFDGNRKDFNGWSHSPVGLKHGLMFQKQPGSAEPRQACQHSLLMVKSMKVINYRLIRQALSPWGAGRQHPA